MLHAVICANPIALAVQCAPLSLIFIFSRCGRKSEPMVLSGMTFSPLACRWILLLGRCPRLGSHWAFGPREF